GIAVILVVARVARVAFAQTREAKVHQPAAAQRAAATATATSSIAGTVRKYEPGKTMLIDSTQGALSFALGADARIVDNAGNAVTSPLKPGERVRVYYAGTNQNRTVARLVVED